MTKLSMADDLTDLCARPCTRHGKAPLRRPAMPAVRTRTLQEEGLPVPDNLLMLAPRSALYSSKAPAGLTQAQRRIPGQAYLFEDSHEEPSARRP